MARHKVFLSEVLLFECQFCIFSVKCVYVFYEEVLLEHAC